MVSGGIAKYEVEGIVNHVQWQARGLCEFDADTYVDLVFLAFKHAMINVG
jgi:hypothetical protein